MPPSESGYRYGSSQEQLLLGYSENREMDNLAPEQLQDKGPSQLRVETNESADEQDREQTIDSSGQDTTNLSQQSMIYKSYKRRWFGLLQLVLLNIVVSWDWLSFSPVANTAATFFSTTPSTINWLSTSFLFAYVIASPVVLYTLHSSGPTLSIQCASVFILFGNWIRYGGTRTSPPSIGLTLFGQILIGFAQPFVLSAPTRYSSLWFSPRGRVSATAVASLANPLGGALGQLVDPFLVDSPAAIPSMTLYIAIFSSAAAIPSFFIPARPPTPISASSSQTPLPILKQLKLLSKCTTFWLAFLPFSVYVGFFNSLSSLLTQILTPYGYSEEESGIAGGLLILVGLVAAAITSPIIDRSKRYLLLIKTFVPTIALCYLVFIWAPPAKSLVAPYLICAVLGAASFSLVPVVLEWLCEVTWPVGPEVGSVVCWAGGQFLGAIFIIISDALQDMEGVPQGNMRKALIFQAVISLAVVPAALFLGVGEIVRNKRLEFDKRVNGRRGPDNVER